MRKKSVFYKTIVLSALVLIFSCSQDPIFFTISTEPIPVKPRIPGSPTNIVEFKRNSVPIMYVASGGLHWYANTGWDSADYGIPQPGGKVISLAATDNHLYALSISDSGVSTVLRRIGPDENAWTHIENPESMYTLVQSIYATTGATGRLFAGAMNSSGSDFGILYLDDTTDPLKPVLRRIIPDSEMLSGAASKGSEHYLCTRGKGVFKVAANLSYEQLEEVGNQDGKNRLFMGMIQLKDGSIIVIQRDGGALFKVEAAGFSQLTYTNGDAATTGRYATGALALWQQVTFAENGTPNYVDGTKMLIAGIQGGLFSMTTSSSYTHGYVEFYIKSDGSFDGDSTRNDPPSITVDGNTDRYTATIGKHPVNYMHQASKEVDAGMTFFASTQTAGFWSYRDRDGGLQWNAEN